MDLRVDRLYKKPTYFIGNLYVDNVLFCNILENAKLAIPAGRYQIVFNYSERFQRIMPEIIGVPGRAGIRIHSANKPGELKGCLAPGFNRIKGQVIESRKTFERLMKILKLYPKIWITIV